MPRTATRRVTSADVARHAGVSRATVSYVVNDVADAGISAETKERVLAAAAELGYSQYGPGRALKSGRSDVVLFVLNDMPVGHAINQLVHELQVRFGANGLSLVLYRVGPEQQPPVADLARDRAACRDRLRLHRLARCERDAQGGDRRGARQPRRG